MDQRLHIPPLIWGGSGGVAHHQQQPQYQRARKDLKRVQKSFEQRIEDLRAYKEKNGHVKVKGSEDKSLYEFCKQMRHARNNPGKSRKLINEERIASLDALGFEWAVIERRAINIKSSEQRIEDHVKSEYLFYPCVLYHVH